MRRLLAFVLSAVLLFGMVPTSLLTALAVGPGVKENNIPNQSLDNAYSQYIPESVIIDGVVDTDTAWANHAWNKVDTNNGTWDSESPADTSKELTYKYQLHYDYEYLYGAFVVDALNAEVTVWLNDFTNQYGVNDAGDPLYGYSHKIVYTIANGAITGDSFADYNGVVPTDTTVAAQQYIKASKKNGNSVTIEFRRYLDSFTSTDAKDIQYFVSVKVGDDSLYFPKIRPVGELTNFIPNATYWPSSADDSNHLTHQEDKETLSPITIDGSFDEAVWSGLTDFYTMSEDPNIVDEKVNTDKGTISFNTVKTHGSQYTLANSDKYAAVGASGAAPGGATGLTYNSGTLSVNDTDEDGTVATASQGVKFKYEYRIDGEYIYIAVVAEVPRIIWGSDALGKVTVAAQDMNQTGKIEQYEIKAEPNFTIQFYNQTGKYFSNVATDPSDKTQPLQTTTSKYNDWAVEHLISFESYRLADNPNYSGAFSNITSRVNETDGDILNVNWSVPKADDTYGQDVSVEATGYQGAGSYQGVYDGFGVWNFECRVKIDSVLSSQNLENNEGKTEKLIEDLGINVVVHDRRWLYQYNSFGTVTNSETDTTYNLQYVYLANGQWYYTNHYNRNAAWIGTNEDQYHYDNLEMLTGTTCSGNTVPGIVIDGNWDKRNNAALVGADYNIDSALREGGYSNKDMQYTYILSADHEYLYGAAVVSNYTSGGVFRIWTNVNGSSLYENSFDFAINKDTGAVSFNSWYANGKGNLLDSTNAAYRAPDSVDLDLAWKKLDNGDVRFEFRIALSEIGAVPTLNPTANQKLLSYYVSFESGSNKGLVHPRCTTIPTAAWDSAHEGRIFYNTPNAQTLVGRAFDHNDSVMLDYIKIDGKLDEEIWDDESDRILVQGNNGQWLDTPARNDIYEYSYVVYTGDNFIYGAVELNKTAIPATNSNGTNYTSIELWLANPGANDGWGVYYNGHKFDNYYYNIYLCADDYFNVAFAASGPSGYMYGGSTPSVDNDCYKWGITTVNGKTYAEFMISTDSYLVETDANGNVTTHSRFNMNETYGADYYINVTHPTDTGETLSLTHPAPAETFYLTHYENIHMEGAGVIYTNLTNTSANDEYLDSLGRWWTHVMFVPDTASGGWKVVATKDGSRTLDSDEIAAQLASDGEAYKNHYGFLPSEIAKNPNCFIYCVNTGNNYIDVIEKLKISYNDYLAKNNITNPNATQRAKIIAELTANGGGVNYYYSLEEKAGLQLNYASSYAHQMRYTIFSWQIGDIIMIPGLDSNGSVATQVQAMLDKQQAQQISVKLTRFVNESAQIPDNMLSYATTEPSFVDPTKDDITYAAGYTEVAKPRWYESGFKNIFTYTKLNENTRYGDKLPAIDYWYSSNPGRLDALEHFSPEKITVDGVLNDTGWSEDGWITVDDDINATYQIDTADKFVLKYQLRTDGEYLYVAAVFEGVEYNATNAPALTLWTKDSGTNWSKYFRVGYNHGKTWANGASYPTIVDPENRFLSTNIEYKNLDTSDMSVHYNNYIDTVYNNFPDKSDPSNGVSLGYTDSALYGYTDVIEEYVRNYYYPDIEIDILKYVYGTESAVMTNDGNVHINGLGNYGDTSTVLEYRVALDEIDADGDGFEYFITAARYGNGKEYTIHYPNVYCEPESDYSYYNLNLPFWKWYSNTAETVTADDLKGDMYLANEYSPVVTLGARFNDDFDGNGSNAIRFGGLYKENYIRKQTDLQDGEYDQTCDYWHVYDLGILIAPTARLTSDLTLDTEGAAKASSIGIVNWQDDSNFADYESFAFYVTLNNIPDGAEAMKFSARTYVQYYDFARVSDDYGTTIVRSIDLIKEHAGSSEDANLPE